MRKFNEKDAKAVLNYLLEAIAKIDHYCIKTANLSINKEFLKAYFEKALETYYKTKQHIKERQKEKGD